MTDPFVAGRGDGLPTVGTAAGYADEEALSYAPKRRPSDALAAITTKAPPIVPSFQQRWSVWAAGYGGSQTTDGNAAARLEQHHEQHLRHGGRRRLSPLAEYARRFCARRRRHQFLGCKWRSAAAAPTCSRPARSCVTTSGAAYLTAALAYGWQDITTDRTVTVAGADRLRARVQRQCLVGPA